MKKILSLLIALNLFILPVFANEITEETKAVTLQEIQNEQTYLGINFEKTPTNSNSKQLITNHKSFLIFNIIINGKIKEGKE